MDAEEAHEYAMSWGQRVNESGFFKWLANSLYYYENPILGQTLDGIFFPNPVGLAAGFDKNALLMEALEAIGLGFIEVGSITARPSKGNPKPRAFRLPKDKALVNRMGLNNHGAVEICHRLQGHPCNIPLGLNVAKTHNPEIMGDKALEDYFQSFKLAQKVADYITLNISCPNTEEGKTFEDEGALSELLQTLLKSDKQVSQPVYVKLSVDLEKEQVFRLTELCLDFGVNGFVATNTSNLREGLNTEQETIDKIGRRGLSGEPLAERSTQIIRWINEASEGRKTIIGVGGIDSGKRALEKIEAGADLLQVYTGLVYKGPALIKEINRSIAHRMDQLEISRVRSLKNQLLEV
jgi:dihydroorotate dehydrogenase